MTFAKGFNLFLGVLGISVCCACMEIRAVDKDRDDVTGSAAPSPVPVAVSAGAWNAYKVFVPGEVANGVIRKSRWDAAAKNFVSPIFVPFSQGSAFHDLDVQPGQVYFYEWGAMKSGQFVAAGASRVAIPLDLEVRGEVQEGSDLANKLFQTSRFGRLIFHDGAVVTTMGRDLEWSADTISFEHTTIKTFAAGATAEFGKAGRSGGRLILKAHVVSGDLRFEGRGENGGNGLAGANPGPELKGEKGPAGQRPNFTSQQGSFGTTLTCTSAGGNGLMGYQGKTGYPGGAGGDGGDSGEIVIRAENQTALKLDSIFDVGHGGLGGLGGAGGEGGDGGDGGILKPGPLVSVQGCAPVLQGPKGPQGPRGAEGSRGAPGQYKR